MGVGIVNRLRAEERGEKRQAVETAKPATTVEQAETVQDKIDRLFCRAIKIDEVRRRYKEAVAKYGATQANRYIGSRADLGWKEIEPGSKTFRLRYNYGPKEQSERTKVFCLYLARHDFTASVLRVAHYCLHWMNYNQGFRFFRSIKQVSDELGMNEKTVRNAFKTLIEHQLLSRDRVSRRSRYTYRICPDAFFLCNQCSIPERACRPGSERA